MKNLTKNLNEIILDSIPKHKWIDKFVETHNFTDKYSVRDLSRWHMLLTKSCAEGRDEFIKRNKAHDDDMFTVSEFFELTKNYWGSDIIERVESKMKSLDKHE